MRWKAAFNHFQTHPSIGPPGGATPEFDDQLKAIREFIDAHEDGSNRITAAEHKRQATLWNRIRWNFSWFLVTVMDYNVSRGLNLGL